MTDASPGAHRASGGCRCVALKYRAIVVHAQVNNDSTAAQPCRFGSAIAQSSPTIASACNAGTAGEEMTVCAGFEVNGIGDTARWLTYKRTVAAWE